MISVNEIKVFVQKAWDRGDVLRGAATGEPQFPLRLRFKKTGGQHAIESFAEVQRWLSELNLASKESIGFGFTVEYSEINHRKLGRQNLPTDIRFDTPEDIAKYLGKVKEFNGFFNVLRVTEDKFPLLHSWMNQHPTKVLPHLDDWHKILDVCEYVMKRPKPGIYLRQISLSGVDSKFFELKKTILSEVLSVCLKENDYDGSITGLARCGFERRFGFLYDQPMIRFRILDKDIMPGFLHRDISVPAGEFSKHEIPGCQLVVITENKINGLAFPSLKGGIVIFGLGYGIGEIASCSWLSDKRIIYWGDIDTHGYGILSMLRSKLPHVESILMGNQDLEVNRSLAVPEPMETRRTDDLTNLDSFEHQAYVRLLPGGDCEGMRIEQERIPFSTLLEAINFCLSPSRA